MTMKSVNERISTSSVYYSPGAVKLFQREEAAKADAKRIEAGQKASLAVKGLIHW